MQSIQKKILKLVVTIALLSSVAFADGEMGGGGLWNNNTPGSTTVVVCTTDQSQTTNGETATCDSESGIDWLLNSIGELLGLND